jgi:hypothetical protein
MISLQETKWFHLKIKVILKNNNFKINMYFKNLNWQNQIKSNKNLNNHTTLSYISYKNV